MNTRERILDSARRLLQTRSYAGFSFQDVADEVGIRKASIYSHFASKDELVTAALETANAWVAEQLQGAVLRFGAVKAATAKKLSAKASKRKTKVVARKAAPRKPKESEQHA